MRLLFGIAIYLFPAALFAQDVPTKAEDQTPTGQFLNATEVKMILNATKPSWVAVREFDGQDLVYLTQVLSWRCGLYQIKYAINDQEMQVWPMHPCLVDEGAPNALPTEAQIYETFEIGSVEKVTIELLYDDLTTDRAEFERSKVLMP